MSRITTITAEKWANMPIKTAYEFLDDEGCILVVDEVSKTYIWQSDELCLSDIEREISFLSRTYGVPKFALRGAYAMFYSAIVFGNDSPFWPNNEGTEYYYESEPYNFYLHVEKDEENRDFFIFAVEEFI